MEKQHSQLNFCKVLKQKNTNCEFPQHLELSSSTNTKLFIFVKEKKVSRQYHTKEL